jgi:hypothetical protein
MDMGPWGGMFTNRQATANAVEISYQGTLTPARTINVFLRGKQQFKVLSMGRMY